MHAWNQEKNKTAFYASSVQQENQFKLGKLREFFALPSLSSSPGCALRGFGDDFHVLRSQIYINVYLAPLHWPTEFFLERIFFSQSKFFADWGDDIYFFKRVHSQDNWPFINCLFFTVNTGLSSKYTGLFWNWLTIFGEQMSGENYPLSVLKFIGEASSQH